MDFLEYMNELIRKIEDSSRLPMIGKRIIDEDVLEVLDRMKALLPEEIAQAQQILQQREQILAEARYEGERLVKERENYLAKMSDDNEINRRAQQLAEKTLEEAKRIAAETIDGANEYADKVLGEMETSLFTTLQTVRKGRQKLVELKRVSLG